MKAKIALITGGFTDESEISLKSADFVTRHLDPERYEVYRIVIDPQRWYFSLDTGEEGEVDRNDFSIQSGGRRIRFDVAFIMLHGAPGEDGRLQGYLDIIGLPYTSCDTLTAALTMNKEFTKRIVENIPGLHVARSILLNDAHRAAASDLVSDRLSLPYFIKPNAGGSSIGMSKVKTHRELSAALEHAFSVHQSGQQVLVEEFVDGREFSVGIFRRKDGSLFVLPCTEVIVSREFFDYEAKYVPGSTQEITPANLSQAQVSRIETIVQAIYNRLNCSGLVRVDFFLQSGTEDFYFIEINTVPGQTEQSFIPQQVRAAGMVERDFYGELIEVALQR